MPAVKTIEYGRGGSVILHFENHLGITLTKEQVKEMLKHVNLPDDRALADTCTDRDTKPFDVTKRTPQEHVDRKDLHDSEQTREKEASLELSTELTRNMLIVEWLEGLKRAVGVQQPYSRDEDERKFPQNFGRDDDKI